MGFSPPYDPRVALPVLGRVFSRPGIQIPVQVIEVEDGRTKAEVEHDRNLEHRLIIRGIKMPFGKRFLNAFGRNLPYSYYFGDWYVRLLLH